MKISRNDFIVPILIVISPLTACAQTATISDRQPAIAKAQEPSCTISDSDREVLLNLDYQSFDQSLPEGGWRKYQPCPILTRDLIDAYTSRHEKTLQKQQWDVLVWHSGQISAMAGDYKDAVAKMNQTFKPNEKPEAAFLWNPYAKGTIAFLEKDRASLVSERAKLARGLSPFNRLNLEHIDAFIRCFDSTYEVAYSEKCDPPESNANRIKALAVPFDYRKLLPKEFFGLADFMKMKKVILVGEMHGTKEVPELFGNLVASIADSKSKTLVVLEITQASQPSIDGFLRTGDKTILKKDPFFRRDFQDGRSSKAMVALLLKLAKMPNITVLCMDPMDANMTGQQRDSGMASFINSHYASFDHTLVLSGNIHSSTALGTPWDKTYRPMGYELKTMARDLGGDQLFNILIRYEKVGAWNCQGPKVSDCKVYDGPQVPTDYSKAVSYQSYFVWEGQPADGHSGSIFIRTSKPSLPFVGKTRD